MLNADIPLRESPKKKASKVWKPSERYEFKLNNEESNFIDFNIISHQHPVIEEDEEEFDLYETIGNKNKTTGNDRFSGLLSRIESLYHTNVGAEEFGYESDSLIDDESVYEDYGRSSINGFFVNSGDLDVKDFNEIEEDSEIDSDDSDGYAYNDRHGTIELKLHPEVEKACRKLEDEWKKLYTSKKRPARFPPELDKYLEDVAHTAYLTHPQHWFTQDVCLRLSLITDFSPTTLKQKMKDMIKKSPPPLISGLSQGAEVSYFFPVYGNFEY